MEENLALVRACLQDKKATGSLPGGVRTLRGRLAYLTKYLEQENLEVKELGSAGVLRLQNWLLEYRTRSGAPLAQNSVAGIMNTCKSFYAWLVEENYVAHNPFEYVKKVREVRGLPKDLPKEEEMGRVLDALEDWEPLKGLRARKNLYRLHVLAELMYASGIRIEEASRLKLEDVALHRSIVIVRVGKGGRSREVYLNERAREVLRLYLEMRPFVFNALNAKNADRVFGMDVGWLKINNNRDLASVCQKVGVAKMTNHSFRHALGYHLLRSGASVRHIQQILGHVNIKSTQIYTKVDKESLRKVIDTYHPRSGYETDENDRVGHGQPMDEKRRAQAAQHRRETAAPEAVLELVGSA